MSNNERSEWSVYEAGLVGPHHVKTGNPSQDFVGHWQSGDTVVVVAADGAGSLALSAEGAFIATNTALDALSAALRPSVSPNEDMVRAALQAAREAVLAEDKSEFMGCTLAIALTHNNEWFAGVVGDAFVVVQDDEGLHFVQEKSDSEYANITKLITSKTFNPVIVSGFDADALVASSDGLQHGTVEKKVPTSGFWVPVLNGLRSGSLTLEDVLQHMESRQLIDDDTTLAVAVRGHQ